jgi:hypothetical protein
MFQGKGVMIGSEVRPIATFRRCDTVCDDNDVVEFVAAKV